MRWWQSRGNSNPWWNEPPSKGTPVELTSCRESAGRLDHRPPLSPRTLMQHQPFTLLIQKQRVEKKDIVLAKAISTETLLLQAQDAGWLDSWGDVTGQNPRHQLAHTRDQSDRMIILNVSGRVLPKHQDHLTYSPIIQHSRTEEHCCRWKGDAVSQRPANA